MISIGMSADRDGDLLIAFYEDLLHSGCSRVFLKAVLVCEDDSMCGGFTFKGVQLQEDLQHEVIVGMMTMMALVHG